MSSSIVSLIFLVVLLVGAVSAAAVAYQGNRRRARVLTRTGLTGGGVSNVPLIAAAGAKDKLSVRLGEIAERFLPEGALSSSSERMLIQAGFESESAPSGRNRSAIWPSRTETLLFAPTTEISGTLLTPAPVRPISPAARSR